MGGGPQDHTLSSEMKRVLPDTISFLVCNCLLMKLAKVNELKSCTKLNFHFNSKFQGVLNPWPLPLITALKYILLILCNPFIQSNNNPYKFSNLHITNIKCYICWKKNTYTTTSISKHMIIVVVLKINWNYRNNFHSTFKHSGSNVGWKRILLIFNKLQIRKINSIIFINFDF